MSSDGLLFSCLSTINEKTQTPVMATLMCGAGAGKAIYRANRFYSFRHVHVRVMTFLRYPVDRFQSGTTRRHGVHRHAHIVHDRLRLRADTEVRMREHSRGVSAKVSGRDPPSLRRERNGVVSPFDKRAARSSMKTNRTTYISTGFLFASTFCPGIETTV